MELNNNGPRAQTDSLISLVKVLIFLLLQRKLIFEMVQGNSLSQGTSAIYKNCKSEVAAFTLYPQ